MSKVRIDATIDVDLAAWALEYGVPLREVREDIKTYILDSFVAHCTDTLGIKAEIVRGVSNGCSSRMDQSEDD